MILDVTPGAGETAARIVEPELAHIDVSGWRPSFLRGNVLRRDEDRSLNDALAPKAARRVGAAPTAKKLTSRSGLMPRSLSRKRVHWHPLGAHGGGETDLFAL